MNFNTVLVKSTINAESVNIYDNKQNQECSLRGVRGSFWNFSVSDLRSD